MAYIAEIVGLLGIGYKTREISSAEIYYGSREDLLPQVSVEPDVPAIVGICII